MQTIIEGLRSVLGEPDFYHQMTNTSNYTWDYGAMFEYFFAGVLLCITVAAGFRFIINWMK